jgi:flagellar biogenesis protein FliO
MKWLLVFISLGVFAGATPSASPAQETQAIKPQSTETTVIQTQADHAQVDEKKQTVTVEEEGTAAEFGEGSVDFTWLFLKTLLAMLVVIASAVIALRFLLPRLTWNRQIKGKTQFKILDRLPLDNKKGIYVVEVEGRRLLLGASEHYVGLITEIEGHEGEDD